MRIYIWKHPSFEQWALALLQSFASLIDSLVMLCSFALLSSSFELAVSGFKVRRHINQLKKSRQQK